ATSGNPRSALTATAQNWAHWVSNSLPRRRRPETRPAKLAEGSGRRPHRRRLQGREPTGRYSGMIRKFFLLARAVRVPILSAKPPGAKDRPGSCLPEPPPSTTRRPTLPHKREGAVKQAEEASFVDLIACERDCRTCSYAAPL